MDAPRALEARPDDDGSFDELVARFADGMVHAEMMSDKSIYIGFTWDDGGLCQMWLSSKKALHVHHEEYKDKPPRFNAWGIEQNPPASAIEARSVETVGLDPKDESAVRDSGDAP